MTQEEKQLLMVDLCGRLPYNIYVNDGSDKPIRISYNDAHFENYFNSINNGNIKPYLRPMSTMTKEEKAEINAIINEFSDRWLNSGDSEGKWKASFWESSETIEYLNSHHFDYRNLIERGLALEAPEGMYKQD